MLEFGIVVFLTTRTKQNEENKIFSKIMPKQNKSKSTEGKNQIGEKIDKICLGFSVFSFVLYNIVYWQFHL
jgi:hypothetical protein